MAAGLGFFHHSHLTGGVLLEYTGPTSFLILHSELPVHKGFLHERNRSLRYGNGTNWVSPEAGSPFGSLQLYSQVALSCWRCSPQHCVVNVFVLSWLGPDMYFTCAVKKKGKLLSQPVHIITTLNSWETLAGPESTTTASPGKVDVKFL